MAYMEMEYSGTIEICSSGIFFEFKIVHTTFTMQCSIGVCRYSFYGLGLKVNAYIQR